MLSFDFLLQRNNLCFLSFLYIPLHLVIINNINFPLHLLYELAIRRIYSVIFLFIVLLYYVFILLNIYRLVLIFISIFFRILIYTFIYERQKY